MRALFNAELHGPKLTPPIDSMPDALAQSQPPNAVGREDRLRKKLSAYLYDLNGATSARVELEHTLRLWLVSNAEEVNVLAHSMGN